MGKPTRKRHGMTNTPLFRRWHGIRCRCYLPTNPDYYRYGGRGIKMCVEWDDFMTFYEWSMANGYADNLSIDRIDNNGDYTPDNCRWVTRTQQQANRHDTFRITAFGETKTLKEWEADPRCPNRASALRQRILAGWTPENAITIPFISGSRIKGSPR